MKEYLKTVSPPILALYIASLVALLIGILKFSPAVLTYDENNFYPNILLLEKYGFGREFLQNMYNQSPGPLYQIIHVFLKPITGLNIVYMRLLNILMLLGSTFFLFKILQTRNQNTNWALVLIAIPMTWVVCGMALTEMPAILCSTAAVYCLQFVLDRDASLTSKFLISALGGFLLGAAIIGRSPFLVAFMAFPVFVFHNNRQWAILLTFSLFTLLLPAFVFSSWGGLVPPSDQGIQSGINLFYGVLALCYAGILTLLIAPSWFIINKNILVSLGVIFVICAVLNCLFSFYTFSPMVAVASKLGSGIHQLSTQIFPALALTFGSFFLLSTLTHLWNSRADIVFVFFTLTFLLILATCVKSSAQFSSRYVGQGMVFFVLMIASNKKLQPKLILLILGAIIGLISLTGYY